MIVPAWIGLFTTIVCALGMVKPGKHLLQLVMPFVGTASLGHLMNPLKHERCSHGQKKQKLDPHLADEKMRMISSKIGQQACSGNFMEVLLCESTGSRSVDVFDVFIMGESIFWMDPSGQPKVKEFGSDEWKNVPQMRRDFKHLGKT